MKSILYLYENDFLFPFQGLKSPAILKSVLDRSDIQIINNTVRCIPVKEVLPLITELTTFMQYRGHPNHSYAM